ncbi:hypothetical protein SKAU_G00004500 [Synaphobranchus kaupii]|uniref:Uncharacterized protein n=1 Tax=Synaphobranchus kaupii TaxID=118154 RepID=A0A9Q1G8Z8_SYNKA|nr:hypothetical protein SKAU_G00004500 [Synaphobranchus kaupii]
MIDSLEVLPPQDQVRPCALSSSPHPAGLAFGPFDRSSPPGAYSLPPVPLVTPPRPLTLWMSAASFISAAKDNAARRLRP